MNKADVINFGKTKSSSFKRYVPHYTPSFPKQAILCKQILIKIHTELQYVEGSVFMKKAKTQNLWTFKLGNQEGIKFPIWIIVGFQQGQDKIYKL